MTLAELSEEDWDFLESCVRQSMTSDLEEFNFSEVDYARKVITNKITGILIGTAYSQLVWCFRTDFNDIPKYVNGGGCIQKGVFSFRLRVGK